MEKIIPRWEWRTFGDGFPEEKNIRKFENTRVRETDEIYILSRKSNDNTKIRDELMDIKTPLRINTETGLEQWTVVMKAGFPIHINDLAIVYKAFGLPLPYLEKDEYSYYEYLEKLIGENSQLRTVNVHKKRFGFMINDCIVEIAEVKFDDIALKTIAVEHADPSLVLKTVQELGLTKYENINYIKAMKRTFDLKY